MYSKKGKMLIRRILSVAISAAMAASFFACVTPVAKSTANAATLANPRVSGGVTTWDRVYFGRYQQSDATGVKKDAIMWRVLQVNGNDAFLVADCNLETQKFNNNLDQYDWSKSIIRSWLNGYNGSYNAYNQSYASFNFINSAFTATEQEAIITTNVAAAPNPVEPTTIAAATTDKIFLLSYEDVNNSSYGFTDTLDESPARKRANTAYVAAGGITKSESVNAAGQNGGWWLRTPGYYTNKSMYISETGSIISCKGTAVNDRSIAVCPALHLDMSKSSVWSYAGTVGSDGKTTAGDNPPSINTEEEVIPSAEEDTKYVLVEDENGEKTVEYRVEDSTAENVTIPDTVSYNGVNYKVTSIAAGTYKNNKNLKAMIIGDNITTIGDNAFSGCTNLQTLVIGKNVKTIGAKAFYKCTKLKKIIIPASVNKIGKQAFYGCKNLKSITIKTTKLTNKKVGAKAFKGTHKKATFKVPKKKLSAYKKLLKSKGASKKAKFKK